MRSYDLHVQIVALSMWLSLSSELQFVYIHGGDLCEYHDVVRQLHSFIWFTESQIVRTYMAGTSIVVRTAVDG